MTSIFLATITFLGVVPTHPIIATSCPDVEVIFARGSGAAANTSEDYQAFKSSLQAELSSRRATVQTRFYDLGTSAHAGHQYPAVSIEDPSVLLGTVIGSGQAFAFGQSVKEGIAELKSYISEINTTCANTKFILAGYSQGAMVISYALQELKSESILYAATFGDPKLYLPEGKTTGLLGKPLACAGKNLSNYRIDVPDCEVDQGILGALNPYQLTPYIDKLGAWCNEADFMCGSYFDLSGLGQSGTYEGRTNPLAGLLKAHLAYKTDDSYRDASKIITDAIAKAYPEKTTTTTSPTHHQNLVILLDVTGSMYSLIDRYRQEALKLAEQVKLSGGTVAIYIYGDELRENFAPKVLCDATCSLSDIETRLSEIKVDGGDDEPESALSALLHVMNTMTWHKSANKSIVLLTDASYHTADINGITLNDVVKRSYEIDPVNIFTITPDYVAPTYSDLTSETGGRSFSSASEISLSTESILSQPYINIGEVRFTDTPSASIASHSIVYSDNTATISLISDTAVAYFLSLDDAPLGLTTNSEFTLTDSTTSNILTITPINPDGRPGIPLTITLSPPSVEATSAQPRNGLSIALRAPNCGAR